MEPFLLLVFVKLVVIKTDKTSPQGTETAADGQDGDVDCHEEHLPQSTALYQGCAKESAIFGKLMCTLAATEAAARAISTGPHAHGAAWSQWVCLLEATLT
eukprot:3225531-Amphidinium_carterae.1